MVEPTTILLVVTTILTAVFVWSRRTYVYWQRRRVKFAQPTHLLGNLKEVLRLRKTFALQLSDFYFDESFAAEPLIGIYLFHQPALLLRDLELVRTVLIDDFVSFSNRFAKCDRHEDRLGAFNLFFVKNPEWREVRTKLTPMFTSAKIKRMFTLMEEIGCDLETYLHKLTDNLKESSVIRAKEICDLYNTDLIASIAFGLRTHSLRSTQQSEIGIHCRQMFMLSFRRAVQFCIIFFLPKLVTLLRPKLFAPAHAAFLRHSITSVIEERERTGELRNDLIEMLVTIKKEADLNQDTSHFSHRREYLAAQPAVFEIAGIQTCAASMAFALFELAKEPTIQERLRAEICAAFGASLATITYDKIEELPYLSMVVDETLRKYPIVPFLERECTPINKKRFFSFRPHAECMARRGMPIYISNYAIHHDPKYWPNPYVFDPERFAPENKPFHTPLSYLPFGAGPHNCVGMSLGLLQVKLGLVHFLREHRVEFCEESCTEIKFDRSFALLANEGGITLRLIKCAQ